jgi:hypothetical protein
LAWALGSAVVVAYGVGLWWWALRDASVSVRAALIAICAAALTLRIVYTTDYPAGLNPDEPKNLACSMHALERGEFFGMACNGVPYLLSTLFAAPLVPLLGFTRWSMRLYSVALSVLAPIAGYAAGRAMALDAIGSLVIAGLLAVLPWSIFFGRVSLGGELVFHQLLLLAALGRLIWREPAGWREALLGGVVLCLLQYDYYAGRAMLAMPFVAAVLAPGGLRRRAWCLAVVVLACVGWLPYWFEGGAHDAHIVRALLNWREPVGASPLHPGLSSAPFETLWQRTVVALRVFVEPVAQLGIWTMPTGALHPWAALVAAGCGLLLTSMRRKLFLLAAFAAGLFPAILSEQSSVSVHRMMLAFPIVTLASGAAVAALPWRTLRAASAAGLLIAVTLSSVMLYFSPRYWTRDARLTFDADRTAVVEQLPDPLPGRVIVSGDLGEYAQLIPQSTEILTTANWWPPVAATYVFAPSGALLAPIYHHAFPGRVQQFGQAFHATVDESARAGGLESHGWKLTITCDGVLAHSAVVPAVFTEAIPPADPACIRASEVTHAWSGRWEGPPTQMRLDYSGRGVVALDDQVVIDEAGHERRLPFAVPHGARVRIAIVAPASGPRASLLELLQNSMRLPSPEHVLPD